MTHELAGERLFNIYKQMVLMRRFEERVGMLYQMRKFSGFCHLYIGQEAIAAGVMAALEPKDQILAGYREHAQAIARGVSGDAIMAELFGRSGGVVGGMGGSMHIFDSSCNFMGGWGIVGAQIPMASGVAFANKYRGNDSVCVCFFGDGSIHQGAFHEAMNMAAMWKLPVIYVCENNRYAMGTPLERQTNVKSMTVKAKAYEVPSAEVNAQDVREVYDHMRIAIDRARAGEGPTLIEMHTYRFGGHSMSDPANYRTKEEVLTEKARDPLLLVKKWLLDEGIHSEDELKAMDVKTKDEIKQMVKFAEQSPPPAREEIWTHLLAE